MIFRQSYAFYLPGKKAIDKSDDSAQAASGIFGASALGMTYRMKFMPFVRPNDLEMAPLRSAIL